MLKLNLFLLLLVAFSNQILAFTTWPQPMQVGDISNYQWCNKPFNSGPNLYTFWADETTHFQSIDQNGNRLWGENGREFANLNFLNGIDVYPSSDGGFFTLNPYPYSIAKYNSSGVCLWTIDNAFQPAPSAYTDVMITPQNVFVTPDNGIKVIYTSRDYDISNIMLSQLNSSGELISCTVLFSDYSQYLFWEFETIMDGVGNLFMLKKHYPDNYISYINSAGLQQDSLQVFPESGLNLRKIFPNNEGFFMLFASSTQVIIKKYIGQSNLWSYSAYLNSSLPSQTALYPDQSGNVYLSIKPNNYDSSTLIQKISSAGFLQWEYLTPPDISNAPSNVQTFVNSNGIIFSNYFINSVGNTFDGYAINFLSSDGLSFWSKKYSYSADYQSYFLNFLNNNRIALIVHKRDVSNLGRGTSYNIFDLAGNSILPDGAQDVFLWDKGAALSFKTLAFNDNYYRLVQSYKGELSLKKYDSHGAYLLDQNPKVIYSHTYAGLMDFVKVNDNTLFCCWTESDEFGYNSVLKGQFFDTQGNILLNPEGVIIGNNPVRAYAYVSNNKVFIIWEAYQLPGGQVREIRRQCLQMEAPLWGENGQILIDSSQGPSLKGVCNDFIEFTNSDNNGNYAYRILRIDENGSPAVGWLSDGLVITNDGSEIVNVRTFALNDSLMVAKVHTLNILKPDGSYFFDTAQFTGYNFGTKFYGFNGFLYQVGHLTNSYYLDMEKFSYSHSGIQQLWTQTVLDTLYSDGFIFPLGDNGITMLQISDYSYSPILHYFEDGTPIQHLPLQNNTTDYKDNYSITPLNKNVVFINYTTINYNNTTDFVQKVTTDSLGISSHELSPLNLSKLTIYPNPFNPNTNIMFNLNKPDRIQVKIYNIKGQLVQTLFDDLSKAGETKLSWNGKNASNQPVSSGLYFCRISSSTKQETRKMILLK